MESSDHATELGDLSVAKDLVFSSERLENLSVQLLQTRGICETWLLVYNLSGAGRSVWIVMAHAVSSLKIIWHI